MQKNESVNGASAIKIVRRTLADGTTKEYRYNREEMKSRHATSALRNIFNQYSATKAFAQLAPKWQRQMLVHMRTIEREIGWMALSDLANVKCREKFYELQEKFAETPHKADLIIATLSVTLAWAYDRGMIPVNHCVKIKRLTSARNSPHRDKCYSEEQERLILAGPQYVRDLYEFALYTGLRLGDICALPASAIDKKGWLKWRPSKTRKKTNVEVQIPTFALPPLEALIGRLRPAGDRLMPWRPVSVSTMWPEWMADFGIEGMRFHDIRHTTSTRLVMAGCTEAERAIILGHATSDGTGAIYTARVKELALNAFGKWARKMENDAKENSAATT